MEVLLPIIVGFCATFVSTLLPGLLNITAAKVGVREGRRNAMIFSLGAATVVFLQAYIAVTFARLISKDPNIIYYLEEGGVMVFVLLTIYFLFIAKKKKPKAADEVLKVRSRTGNYFMGMMLSALNFFPIPYYVFISVSFTSYQLFSFSNLYVFLFVLGATVGSFSVFYLYIIFFRKFEEKTEFIMRNVNYFIGSITGLIALVTMIRIWGSHY